MPKWQNYEVTVVDRYGTGRVLTIRGISQRDVEYVATHNTQRGLCPTLSSDIITQIRLED